MTRCVARDCLDGPPVDDQPAPRLTRHGLLCDRDTRRLEQHLAELPARVHQLRAVLPGVQAPKRDGSRHTKGHPPVPLNLAAHDHLDLLAATVTSWVRLVAEERGLRGPDRPEVGRLSGWLLGQLDWLVEQPWVDDLAEEMRDLSRVADGLTQVRPGWHVLPAPCPRCSGPDDPVLTLGRWDGDDHVGCSTCGERWAEEEYPRLVLVLSQDVTVTAEEAARRAKVESATFRQWVSRGYVQRVGTVEGLARYSTKDVDAMTREESA